MNSSQNWNDVAGWDAYHRAEIAAQGIIPTYTIEDALRYAPSLLKTASKRVWFAGCGTEISPWLYANLGCEVLATDISPLAIQYQNELLFDNPIEVIEHLQNVLKEMELLQAQHFVHPTIFLHDMRQPLPFPPVDMIVNRRSLHGFAAEEISQIAQVYATALKQGGWLVCDTLNMPGEGRTALENALESAGFFVPGKEAMQWFRTQLDATGITYVMVLNNPVIPQWGQYDAAEDSQQLEKDRAILASFSAEFQQRRKENFERDKATFREGIDQLATIIYTTS